MHNRNQVKWAPFNSVINGKYIIKSIENEKNKIDKPILSEEQISTYEKLIFESFINKIELIFNVYKSGYITEIKGNVMKIEKNSNKIILNSNRVLYFCEIVKVKYCN